MSSIEYCKSHILSFFSQIRSSNSVNKLLKWNISDKTLLIANLATIGKYLLLLSHRGGKLNSKEDAFLHIKHQS